MTKITHINDPTLAQKPKQNQAKSVPGAFDQVLQKTVGQQESASTGVTGPTSSLPPPMAMMMPPMGGISQTSSQDILSQQADSLIDQLDGMATDFGNPLKSLKEISGSLSSLETIADQLTKSAEMSGAPSEVTRAAKTLALTAKVEAIKFNRGDYI